MKHILWMIIAVALLAACQPAAPKQSFVKGDEVAFYDFTAPGTFEEGTFEESTARLEISNGRYNINVTEGDSVLWYGQWGNSLADVVIDVETRQLTEDQNTTYGVMCRARGTVGQGAASIDPELQNLASEALGNAEIIASAETTPEADATAEATAEATIEAAGEATAEATEVSPSDMMSEVTAEATFEEGASNQIGGLEVNNGDGYLFLVQGSGRFAIMRSRGRSVTPLLDWTDSAVIAKGAANNRIRAVCLGDYLALYVNGEFLGDATDDTYTAGQIGMVAAAAGRLGVQVEFDNLSVSEAKAS
ncbi:MAG: DUF1349 domain-containing protein [Anaerolineae bacterium]|nr:DUF1349 domain-containing protein [Anaerolineae bacterium]